MCRLGAAGRRTGTARPTIARALEKLQSALQKSRVDRASHHLAHREAEGCCIL